MGGTRIITQKYGGLKWANTHNKCVHAWGGRLPDFLPPPPLEVGERPRGGH